MDIGVVADRSNGQNVQKEIDFVVNDADKRIYIQSAFRMDTESKADAEIGSLLLTKDFFKKIVIRLDIPHNYYDDNGIFHCNLLDFLLERCELFRATPILYMYGSKPMTACSCFLAALATINPRFYRGKRGLQYMKK